MSSIEITDTPMKTIPEWKKDETWGNYQTRCISSGIKPPQSSLHYRYQFNPELCKCSECGKQVTPWEDSSVQTFPFYKEPSVMYFSCGNCSKPPEIVSIDLMSFGFKFGAISKNEHFDMIQDVRKGIFNPVYIAGNRTGEDKEIEEIILAKGGEAKAQEIYKFICERIDKGFNQVRVAVGCIGGKHRSVAIVNRVQQLLKQQEVNNKGFTVNCKHRNIKD